MKAIENTSLIVCHYGGHNESRRDATLRAVQAWNCQTNIPNQSRFLELVLPGQRPCFGRADFPEWIQYIRLFGKERNRSLFQKEAMWNLGAKFTSAQKLFFIDGDCMPVDCPDWFSRVFGLCEPGTAVHPAWHLVHEGQEPVYTDYYSLFAPKESIPEGKRCYPGLGYCLHRADFDAMDGFNPFSIIGAGDCVFVYERLRSIAPRYTFAKRMFHSIVRENLPQLKWAVPMETTVQHNFHGGREDRAYRWSRELICLFGSPKAYVHIDRAGLLAWNDPKFWLADIAMEKTRMHTRKELMELIVESANARLDHQEAMYRTDDTDFNKEDFNDN